LRFWSFVWARRHVISLCGCSSLGQFAFLDTEFVFLLFGILATGIIYGSLAGVIGTLMM
jgi:hypothetical protein